MIVRVSGEGQWRVAADVVERLNAIDNTIVQAVEHGDEHELRRRLAELADVIAREGEPVPEDELATSDLVVPARDTSLTEARALFAGEGLLPG